MRSLKGYEITATVDEFKEQLYLEYVKFSFKWYEKKILTWKLELIDSADSKYILEELDKTISKLNYYESEINESEFLQPYLSPIQDSFIFFRNEIEKIKKNFNTEQTYLNTDITTKIKKETSNGRGFFFNGKNESVDSLITIIDNIWKYFKERGLIAKNTKFSEFRKIFTHHSIKEKTIWLGDINQLYYFIKLLVEQNAYKHIRNKQKWEITVNCFCLNNQQEILTEQLKSTKEPKTDKKMEILEAIKFFTKLR